jgi:hypothetical protein
MIQIYWLWSDYQSTKVEQIHIHSIFKICDWCVIDGLAKACETEPLPDTQSLLHVNIDKQLEYVQNKFNDRDIRYILNKCSFWNIESPWQSCFHKIIHHCLWHHLMSSILPGCLTHLLPIQTMIISIDEASRLVSISVGDYERPYQSSVSHLTHTFT